MPTSSATMGILVGGGPAPGINGVISAATIEARKNDIDVLGFHEGFKYLMAGKTDHFTHLKIEDVSRILWRGGSILGTSRANPTKKPQDMETVKRVLGELNVRYLLTIGGDDTAHSASKLSESAGTELAVAHVPKTIDNDLPLPPSIPTFGFETARHVGVGIAQNLMADAQTTSRWYVVVAMGRNAGHLALGIGKAAAVHLTLIPEEFGDKPITLPMVCDIVESSMIKREALGRSHGVVILAEGLVEGMSEEHIKQTFDISDINLDDHGHVVLEDIELGKTVRDELRRRLEARGEKTKVISKNLGYELRCADPIPYDIEYTRDLGYGAVRFLMSGQRGAVITFQGGNLKPLKFEDLRDPRTGRPRLRLVDIQGESYQVARKYMIRLEKRDRDDPELLEKLVKASNLSRDEFLKRFSHLMQ